MIHSQARTDALVLMALVLASPASPLVVKCMKGLFAHQKKGRWNNTQENVWSLLAIDSYFQVSCTCLMLVFASGVFFVHEVAGHVPIRAHDASTQAHHAISHLTLNNCPQSFIPGVREGACQLCRSSVSRGRFRCHLRPRCRMERAVGRVGLAALVRRAHGCACRGGGAHVLPEARAAGRW